MARKQVGAAPTSGLDAVRKMDVKNPPIFYPEDFGAAGDGVTNDTTAINAAQAAAVAAGGTVWLGAGRRYLAGLAFTDQNVRIKGGGTLVQAPGVTALRVTHEPSEEIAVTSQAVDRLGPATSVAGKETNAVTRLNVAAGSLNKFGSDEPWLIRSRDIYPWANRPSGGSSLEYPEVGAIWFQDWALIMGVVLPFTASGTWTIREGDTIVGATSGATAQVVAHHADALLVRKVTGTFTTTENLTVGGTQGGTINGAGWVALHGVLDDTFATTVVLLRARTDLAVDLELSIEAAGDVNAVTGSSARTGSVKVYGAVAPKIDLDVKSTYATGLELAATFRPQVKVRISDAPSIVVTGGSASNIPTEGAYGYGVEIIGAVAEGYFDIQARNVRHAFTTNAFPFSGGTSPSYPPSNRLMMGVGRDNVVTGMATDCKSAGWDTHEGFRRTTFKDCHNVRTLSGGRYQSGPSGFQNRSPGTRYLNCTDTGSIVGFSSSEASHRQGTLQSVVEYIDCEAIDFASTGFAQTQAAYADSVHRARYVNCRGRGDGRSRPSSGPHTQQVFSLSGMEVELVGCAGERFNGDLILVAVPGTQAVKPTIFIDRLTADFRDAPNTNSVNLIRTFSTNFRVVVGDVFIYQNPTYPAQPNHVVRPTSGNPEIVFAGEHKVLNTMNNVPRWLTSAGVPVYSYAQGQQPRISPPGTTRPTDPLTGDLFPHTANGLERWDGTVWTVVASPTGPVANVGVWGTAVATWLEAEGDPLPTPLPSVPAAVFVK